MSSRTRPAPILIEIGLRVAGRLAELLDLDDEIVGAHDVGMARGRAQVDAFGNAAHGGELLRHLLGHQLAAEAGLRALGNIDFQRVGLAACRGCSSPAARTGTGRSAGPPRRAAAAACRLRRCSRRRRRVSRRAPTRSWSISTGRHSSSARSAPASTVRAAWRRCGRRFWSSRLTVASASLAARMRSGSTFSAMSLKCGIAFAAP